MKLANKTISVEDEFDFFAVEDEEEEFEVADEEEFSVEDEEEEFAEVQVDLDKCSVCKAAATAFVKGPGLHLPCGTSAAAIGGACAIASKKPSLY